MEERDALAFGTEAGRVVNEPDTCCAAACEAGIEVVHGKTNVMNTGTSFGDELADGRVGGVGLEQFDQRFSGLQPGDAGTIRVLERDIGQAENVTIEGQDLAKRVNGNAYVGNARGARRLVGHGECAGVMGRRR